MSQEQTIPFVPFCEDVLGVRLSPAQRVLAKVAIDGAEPRDLAGKERDLARQLFGDVETIPRAARAVLVTVCGGRSGKSYVFDGLYSLWRALTADLTTLAPGEFAFAIIVAPDMRLARQGLRFAVGAAKDCPSIACCIEGETAESITLRRDDNALVTIECLPATRGGAALRGRSLVSAVLDEAAFFRDEGYQVNDTEIFRAVAPRVLPGGLVILASTPWAESGVLYEEFSRNHGHPVTAIAAHAPTLLMLNTERNREVVARERERDPDNALREFDAQFMPAGSGLFFDPFALGGCVDTSMPLELPPAPECAAFGAFDPAYARDAAAGCVVRARGDLFEVCEVFERVPKKGSPLVPSATDREFAAVVQKHGAQVFASDIHYREAVKEHIAGLPLQFVDAPGGNAGKALVYGTARDLIHAGRVRWSVGHKRLVQQMRDVVSKPLPGGLVAITSPRRRGAHGDLASALCLALWLAVNQSRHAVDWDQVERANARFNTGGLGLNEPPLPHQFANRWSGTRGRGF